MPGAQPEESQYSLFRDRGRRRGRRLPALSSLLTAVGVYLWPNKPYVQVDNDAALDNGEHGVV